MTDDPALFAGDVPPFAYPHLTEQWWAGVGQLRAEVATAGMPWMKPTPVSAFPTPVLHWKKGQMILEVWGLYKINSYTYRGATTKITLSEDTKDFLAWYSRILWGFTIPAPDPSSAPPAAS